MEYKINIVVTVSTQRMEPCPKVRHAILYILDCVQAPEEVDDWSTPLEATEDGNLCPECDMIYILDCPQAPEEVDDWSTPLEATEDGNLCPQYDRRIYP